MRGRTQSQGPPPGLSCVSRPVCAAQARSATDHGEDVAADPCGVCELLPLPVSQETVEEQEFQLRRVSHAPQCMRRMSFVSFAVGLQA